MQLSIYLAPNIDINIDFVDFQISTSAVCVNHAVGQTRNVSTRSVPTDVRLDVVKASNDSVTAPDVRVKTNEIFLSAL